ncbi:MAG: hypothetical protein R3C41_10145 [Calditrichia bacterium]
MNSPTDFKLSSTQTYRNRNRDSTNQETKLFTDETFLEIQNSCEKLRVRHMAFKYGYRFLQKNVYPLN